MVDRPHDPRGKRPDDRQAARTFARGEGTAD
jgi:hypothetical protein